MFSLRCSARSILLPWIIVFQVDVHNFYHISYLIGIELDVIVIHNLSLGHNHNLIFSAVIFFFFRMQIFLSELLAMATFVGSGIPQSQAIDAQLKIATIDWYWTTSIVAHHRIHQSTATTAAATLFYTSKLNSVAIAVFICRIIASEISIIFVFFFFFVKYFIVSSMPPNLTHVQLMKIYAYYLYINIYLFSMNAQSAYKYNWEISARKHEMKSDNNSLL